MCKHLLFWYPDTMTDITIFTDGGSRGNPGPAAVGVQIIDKEGKVLREVSETIGNATNNYAEYMAVVRGLQTAKEVLGKASKENDVELKLDSELIQKQLTNQYQIKDPGLVPFFIEIHNMRVASFPKLTITHVKREHNKEADRLVNEALDA